MRASGRSTTARVINVGTVIHVTAITIRYTALYTATLTAVLTSSVTLVLSMSVSWVSLLLLGA